MDKIIEELATLKLDSFTDTIRDFVFKKRDDFNYTDNKLINKFKGFYDKLPNITTTQIDLNSDYVTVGIRDEIDENSYNKLKEELKNFIPWRKGPFKLFGIKIDTEWASNLKWDRFASKIELKNKKILDIGSSNGYYMFKMAHHNPAFVLGVEPFIPYYYQFKAVNKYLNLNNIFTLPCTFNELPKINSFFDTVFLMGVLYHRKSPIKMLSQIRMMMDKNGELILENLIIPGDEPLALIPEQRYAKMNNVHFIPTIKTLEIWLTKSGFKDIECLDITKTDSMEQRKTDWTFAMSLDDFLDPVDKSKTIEGYPAPLRAVIKAK